eukprot:8488596-Pyramimonas_sp.AAC.1
MGKSWYSNAPWKLKANLVKGLLVNTALSGMEVWAKGAGPLAPRDLAGLEGFIVAKGRAILQGT